jgi:peptide deformylase
MESLRIRTYGDEILKRRSETVEKFDEDLLRTFEDMVETMILEEGVGLAAPQVGIPRRIAVVNPDPGNDETLIKLVNPEIVSSSEETESIEEGCLSVPGIRGKVTRPARISVEYQDEHGVRKSLTVEGLVSRIIQHELDHLNGILFVERLSFGRKTMIKGKLRDLARHERRE